MWYPHIVRTEDVCALAGRLLVSVIFLASAFGKITNFEATTRFMSAHGLPSAVFLCALAALVEALGGISLILGYQTRLAAGVLAAFLVAATGVFHLGSSPEQRIHLLKNLAILGGLLKVMAFGPGPISLEDGSRTAR